MYAFKRLTGLLSFAVLAGLLLSIAGVPTIEAGGKGNHIETNFALIENTTFVFPVGATGQGKFDFNTKKGEFNLSAKAEGLVSGETYRVRATVRNTFDGKAAVAAIILDVPVVADGNGEIAVTRKHVALELLKVAPDDGSHNWRIDQQLVLTGIGTKFTCVDCILVCAPTTKVSLVDGKLIEG